MNPTLKAYQDAMRNVEHIENDISATTQEKDAARATFEDAKTKWDTEREALTEESRVQYAQQAAREEVHSKPSAVPETELAQVKRLIKACRKNLLQAREDNKALYAQLSENRHIKKQLNDEYDELRARKRTLEQVSA
jgi:chromosome segregation ATPase